MGADTIRAGNNDPPRQFKNRLMNHMSKFVMTDPNGTHLEGYTLDPVKRPGYSGTSV